MECQLDNYAFYITHVFMWVYVCDWPLPSNILELLATGKGVVDHKLGQWGEGIMDCVQWSTCTCNVMYCIMYLAGNFRLEKMFTFFIPCSHGRNFTLWIFFNDYIELMVTFAARAKFISWNISEIQTSPKLPYTFLTAGYLSKKIMICEWRCGV